MEQGNRPIGQLSPLEIERQIDALIAELSRDGGEYQPSATEPRKSALRRLFEKLTRRASGKVSQEKA